jgi:hypothetical protein
LHKSEACQLDIYINPAAWFADATDRVCAVMNIVQRDLPRLCYFIALEANLTTLVALFTSRSHI